MALDEVKREIDGATEMFQAWEQEHGIQVSPSIHLTGGEPFLYDGLWDVVAYARENGYRVAMMTNGSLITRDSAQKASSLGVSDIQVSLEGHRTLHDAIRGNGSFLRAERGVRLVVEAGNRASANVTLSRLNADTVEETAGIAREMGC